MHSILSRCLNSIQGYIKLAFSQHMKLISICFLCTTREWTKLSLEATCLTDILSINQPFWPKKVQV